ncbi:hypothetical protein ZWY2020_036894 [Hordeum vulgare]|nr:hypothetical protein ZWY2020_036894 [Hordeum vulgare]
MASLNGKAKYGGVTVDQLKAVEYELQRSKHIEENDKRLAAVRATKASMQANMEANQSSIKKKGVKSCYDEGKRTTKTLTMGYHRGANLEVRIARICNTYGPRMCIDDGRVVSNFVAQALRKEPLTVYGDGKQTRSFQYISDLVEGLMRLMEGDHIGPFNLGNPGKFTMLELAKVVQDTIDHDGEFNNTIMMMVC